MRNIEFRFIYNRKGQLNKDGKALVQLEIYQDRKRKFFSTGIYLTPKQWDASRQRPRQATMDILTWTVYCTGAAHFFVPSPA